MHEPDLSAYAGQWVALWQRQVVGMGATPEAALTLARHNRPKDRFSLRFVERVSGTPLRVPPLLAQLRPFFDSTGQPVYLVGGAVRDMLLGRPTHDLDFAVAKDAIRLAFRVGDAFGWPAYVLDQERDTGRVVLPSDSTLDFARFRGASLEADLRDRDFTINAMALPATAVYAESIIDPLDGRSALNSGLIALTHPLAITADPVRALRAVRQKMQFGFAMTAETEQAAAAARLQDVSIERIRDEFIKLLETAVPHRAIDDLYRLNLLYAISPDLSHLFAEPTQRQLALDTVKHGVHFMSLVLDRVDDGAQTLDALLAFWPALRTHWLGEVDGGLNRSVLFRIGLLFQMLPDTVVDTSLGRLAFSNRAVSTVATMVGHQARLGELPLGKHLSRRAIYRYFRDAGSTGLDAALIGLAKWLAQAPRARVGSMADQVDRLRQLFYAYFEQYEAVIDPKLYVDGRDLMHQLHLDPGPEVGRLLRLLKEEQAAGHIHSAAEALHFAQSLMG